MYSVGKLSYACVYTVCYLSSCALPRQWSPILLYLPSHAFWYLSNSWEAACIVYRRSKGVTPCRVNERLLCICICAQGWRASPGSEARRAERWANLYKIASIRRLLRTDRSEGHAQRSCAVQPPGTTTIRVRWIELRLWVRCSIFKNKV